MESHKTVDGFPQKYSESEDFKPTPSVKRSLLEEFFPRTLIDSRIHKRDAPSSMAFCGSRERVDSIPFNIGREKVNFKTGDQAIQMDQLFKRNSIYFHRHLIYRFEIHYRVEERRVTVRNLIRFTLFSEKSGDSSKNRTSDHPEKTFRRFKTVKL
jgi:hypothetical protein